MTAYDVIKLSGFPEKALVDKKVFKKVFYKNAGLTKQQVELFKNDVDEIRWYYALKQENINIPGFKNEDIDYQEVQVIGVILRDDKYAYSIAEIIQKAIQYSVILMIEHAEKVILNVAYKRINKADISKSVVDEIYNSDWINGNDRKEKDFLDSIKIKNLSFSNLYEFYQDFVNHIKLFAVCVYKHEYEYISREKTKELYDKYLELIRLEEKLQKKKCGIKSESDFSKKVSLNVKIKELEQKKEQYIHNINI